MGLLLLCTRAQAAAYTYEDNTHWPLLRLQAKAMTTFLWGLAEAINAAFPWQPQGGSSWLDAERLVAIQIQWEEYILVT